jgi:hypothetical protein
MMGFYKLRFYFVFLATVNVVVQVHTLTIGQCFAESHSGPFVIITVDVETTKYDSDSPSLPLPEQVHAICEEDVPCGMQEMVRLLREHGYPATFFFNVYEYKKYGEQPVMKIVKWLDESGQDVQLHTHPQWAYDRNRSSMYQYSLKEQIKIIKDGKGLLQAWTGKPVIAHRAGAYGADRNTLEALIANDILYDSSLFYGWPNSRINDLELKKNVLSMYGPLYEFAVTVYKKKQYPSVLKNSAQPVEKIRKYDVNWFGDQAEAGKALQEALDMKLDFIMLFLHSFSFIKTYEETGEMQANAKALDMFEYVLDFISKRKLDIITFRDIRKNKIKLEQYLNKPDIIPEVPLQISIILYAGKLLGINRENVRVYAAISGFAGVLLICALIFANKKKRKQHV